MVGNAAYSPERAEHDRDQPQQGAEIWIEKEWLVGLSFRGADFGLIARRPEESEVHLPHRFVSTGHAPLGVYDLIELHHPCGKERFAPC